MSMNWLKSEKAVIHIILLTLTVFVVVMICLLAWKDKLAEERLYDLLKTALAVIVGVVSSRFNKNGR